MTNENEPPTVPFGRQEPENDGNVPGTPDGANPFGAADPNAATTPMPGAVDPNAATTAMPFGAADPNAATTAMPGAADPNAATTAMPFGAPAPASVGAGPASAGGAVAGGPGGGPTVKRRTLIIVAIIAAVVIAGLVALLLLNLNRGDTLAISTTTASETTASEATAAPTPDETEAEVTDAPAPPPPPVVTNNPPPTQTMNTELQFVSFSASQTTVTCADPADAVPITVTWSSLNATEAWFGVDTFDASAAPLTDVPTSGSYTWNFFCGNTSTVFTVTIMNGSGDYEHRSVTITRA